MENGMFEQLQKEGAAAEATLKARQDDASQSSSTGTAVEVKTEDTQPLEGQQETNLDGSMIRLVPETSPQDNAPPTPPLSSQDPSKPILSDADAAELQRFRSENGRTKALADENKLLRDQLEAEKVATAKALSQANSNPLPKTDEDLLSRFSDDERAQVSEDVLLMMARREDLVSVQLAKRDAEISQLRNKTNQVEQGSTAVRETAFQKAIAGIGNLGVECRTQAWADFTQAVDDASGIKYGQLLQQAGESFNVERVRAIYDRFVQSNTTSHNKATLGFKPKNYSSTPASRTTPNLSSASLRRADYLSLAQRISRGQANGNDPKVKALMEQYEEASLKGELQ